MRRLRKLNGLSGSVLLTNVCLGLGQFVLPMSLARMASADVVAQYVLTTSVFSILYIASALQLKQLMLQRGDVADRVRCYCTLRLLSGVLALAGTVVCVFAFKSEYGLLLTVAICSARIGDGLVEIASFGAITSGCWVRALVMSVCHFALRLGLVILLYSVEPDAGHELVLWGVAAFSFVVPLVSVRFVGPWKVEFREFMSAVAPMGVALSGAAVVATVGAAAPRFLLDLWGSSTDVASFSVLMTLFYVVGQFCDVSVSDLVIRRVGAVSRGDSSAGSAKLFLRLVWWWALVSSVALVGIWHYGEATVAFAFGPVYADFGKMLWIVGIASSVNFVGSVVSAVVIGLGHGSLVFRAGMLTFVVSLAIYAVLVFRWQLSGALVGCVCSSVIRLAMVCFLSRRPVLSQIRQPATLG